MKDDMKFNEVNCISSSDDRAFIQRTQQLIKQYKKYIQEEKARGHKPAANTRTLFINCCLGLLIIPRETMLNDKLLETGIEEWGINGSTFTNENGACPNLKLKELLRHLRNSLAHNHFVCHYSRSKVLTGISFTDYRDKKEKDLSFSGYLRYKDFETIVNLLADYSLESNEKDRYNKGDIGLSRKRVTTRTP